MRDRPIRLSDGIAEVVVVPGLGAGLARYDLRGTHGPTNLLRPGPDDGTDPFALACNLLLPWSNRVSGGGFTFEGRFHALRPNVPGEPCPIHGTAFARPWQVAEAGPRSARLVLDDRILDDRLRDDRLPDGPAPGPFRYRAEVSYALEDGALVVELQAANAAPVALPYGLGLHPWLPRTPGTTLRARAAAAWLEDGRHLPAGRIPVGSRPAWDFARGRELPAGWINNAFGGWDGVAVVHWPERRLGLSIEASAELSTFVLYSPGRAADFFCFEPVMHPVDALNLPGGPAAHGMAILQPGDVVRARCRFEPFAKPEAAP